MTCLLDEKRSEHVAKGYILHLDAVGERLQPRRFKAYHPLNDTEPPERWLQSARAAGAQ